LVPQIKDPLKYLVAGPEGATALCWNHDWPAWLWSRLFADSLERLQAVRAREDKPLAASTYGWSTSLRVFILYANPVAASFGATLHRQVITTLRLHGHEIDDCDLYAESFDPILNEQERIRYHNVEANRAPIAGYADRLLAAEALVLVYPVLRARPRLRERTRLSCSRR
jgi:hypothetical protein